MNNYMDFEFDLEEEMEKLDVAMSKTLEEMAKQRDNHGGVLAFLTSKTDLDLGSKIFTFTAIDPQVETCKLTSQEASWLQSCLESMRDAEKSGQEYEIEIHTNYNVKDGH